jgi:hypothetical protein
MAGRGLAQAIISLLLGPQIEHPAQQRRNAHEIRVSRTAGESRPVAERVQKGAKTPGLAQNLPEFLPDYSRSVRAVIRALASADALLSAITCAAVIWAIACAWSIAVVLTIGVGLPAMLAVSLVLR